MPVQKPPGAEACSEWRPQLLAGPSAFSRVAVLRSKPERFRSTPWRCAWASMPARRGCPARGGPSCRTLVTPSTRDIWAAAPRASIAPEARLGLEMLNLSRPNSTPPYTLCFLEPTPSSAFTILPSCTDTREWQRSFHSCGITSERTGLGCSTRLSQVSFSWMFDSTKNLAMTDAFASSRRWKTALLLSAISSKFRVNASAYFTMGCVGRVMAESSMPSAPLSCSRASTAIST
mmetsp:Transcript_2678/g.8976  ORF Transcript_2678/g.8976 Transcript_2678/m.8976 type:complete len:233 (-) Transcript_2678:1641-2339(-)